MVNASIVFEDCFVEFSHLKTVIAGNILEQENLHI